MLTSCSSGSNEYNADYEETKKMVVDILQTDDGKKAIQKMMQEDDMKRQLVIDSDIVQASIKDTFTSHASKEMWKKLFNDTEFAATFAEVMAEEQKELFKKLMNDATFQKSMLELLQNPEISNQTLSILKGQQFREHLETAIEETLNAPLFQLKVKEWLLTDDMLQGESEGETTNKQDETTNVNDDNNTSEENQEENE